MFSDGARPKLTVEQDVALSDALQAAAAQVNMGNFDDAEDTYIRALAIDCTSPEARARLQALNKDKAKEIIASCKF